MNQFNHDLFLIWFDLKVIIRLLFICPFSTHFLFSGTGGDVKPPIFLVNVDIWIDFFRLNSKQPLLIFGSRRPTKRGIVLLATLSSTGLMTYIVQMRIGISFFSFIVVWDILA